MVVYFEYRITLHSTELRKFLDLLDPLSVSVGPFIEIGWGKAASVGNHWAAGGLGTAGVFLGGGGRGINTGVCECETNQFISQLIWFGFYKRL